MRHVFLRVTLPFTAIGFLNQAGRIVVALVGPAIALEFGLSASGLGALAAAFFAAYALSQLPIGLAMDLHGPRRVQVTLALVAAAGFGLCAAAPDPAWLAVGRFVSGIGIAGALIAVMKANVQFYPPTRLAAVTGAAVFIGGAGAMAGTLPVQWLLPLIGWRGAFLLLAALALGAAVWIRLSVPARPPQAGRRRPLGAEIGEFGRIFAHRQFTRYAPAVALASGMVFTYQGLWAGPWLRDVAGLDGAARASVLLAYACGMMTGHLLSGLVASRVQARGGDPMVVPFFGMAGMAVAQVALIAAPTGLITLHLLWYGFAAVGSCGPVAYAVLAQRFPQALTARVTTAMNGTMLALVFLLQTVIGLILDLWPRSATGGWDPAGYGWALGLTLALQAGTIAWMLLAPRLFGAMREGAWPSR